MHGCCMRFCIEDLPCTAALLEHLCFQISSFYCFCLIGVQRETSSLVLLQPRRVGVFTVAREHMWRRAPVSPPREPRETEPRTYRLMFTWGRLGGSGRGSRADARTRDTLGGKKKKTGRDRELIEVWGDQSKSRKSPKQPMRCEWDGARDFW